MLVAPELLHAMPWHHDGAALWYFFTEMLVAASLVDDLGCLAKSCCMRAE
jgi:hypothetical protein